MNNSVITGLANPVESSDAATKGWAIQEVESRLAAIDSSLSTTPNVFKFYEANIGGVEDNYVQIKGPGTLNSNYDIILPNQKATVNQILVNSDANSGSMVWKNVNELVDLTDNQENIGIGDQTLESLTQQTGNDDNIALGNKTLSLLTSGSHNIALGDSTFLGLESGSENVAVGSFSGYSSLDNNTSSSFNTFIGFRTGYNTTGSYNVFLGHNSGSRSSLTTGTKNVFLGANISSPEIPSNQIIIGYGATSQGNNTFSVGNNEITNWIPGSKLKTSLGSANNPFETLIFSGKLNVYSGALKYTSGGYVANNGKIEFVQLEYNDSYFSNSNTIAIMEDDETSTNSLLSFEKITGDNQNLQVDDELWIINQNKILSVSYNNPVWTNFEDKDLGSSKWKIKVNGKNSGDLITNDDQIYFESRTNYLISLSNGNLETTVDSSQAAQFNLKINYIDSNLYLENYSVKMPTKIGSTGNFLRIKNITNNNATLEWTNQGGGTSVSLQGVANQTNVNLSDGTYTIGLPDDVTINGSLKINNYTLPSQLNNFDSNKVLSVNSNGSGFELKSFVTNIVGTNNQINIANNNGTITAGLSDDVTVSGRLTVNNYSFPLSLSSNDANKVLTVNPNGNGLEWKSGVTLTNTNYLSISGQEITGGTVPITSGGTGANSVAAARIALGVDPAGTDNSTNVTLANNNYLSISGQQITGKTVPIISGGTGATTAIAARIALGVDPAGTDNSTNVSLANTNYLTISGQQITGGTVPIVSGGTGATSVVAARISLGVDPAGTDNSTNVTLANTNYLSINGQQITGKTVPITSGGTGATSVVAARIALDVDPAGTDNSTNVTLANTNYLSINGQQITGKTVPVTSGGTGATSVVAARIALDVDPAGTDNSTNVTLANTNYLSINGQQITGKTVPVTSGGTGATSVVSARIALGVDPAGTDNSTNVTLANTNYLSINGQQITGKTVPVTSGGTGATSVVSARIALGVDPAGTDNSTNVTLANTNYLSINGQQITGKTVPVTSGGTGITSISSNQMLIGNNNGTGFDKRILTAGSNISITNENGNIEIAYTGSNQTGTGDIDDGAVTIPKLNLNSGTDIGADLTDSDLVVVHDMSSNEIRKSEISRLKTYIGNKGYDAVWYVGTNGSEHYTITGPGTNENALNDIEITVQRNKKYKFIRTTSGHPFRIRVKGSSTNLGTNGSNGVTVISVSGKEIIEWDVPYNSEPEYEYYCTAHPNMVGTITVIKSSTITLANTNYLSIEGQELTGNTVPITSGGTGATSVAAARTALGVDAAGTDNSTNVTLANTNYLSIDGQELTGKTVPITSGGTGATSVAAARTALEVDVAGTDNSTNVTLANTNYLSIEGQELTGNTVPIASGGTGATTVAAARTALEVDVAGTDNSTNVTLANTNYLSIEGQELTGNTVPIASGGTGATTVAAARTALEVDVAGTDNSTNVTLANTNYLSIDGQELTGKTVPITSGGTGATSVAAARTALEVDVAGTDNSTNVTLANTNYLSIEGQELTGNTVPIASGGTGATTVAAARTALEVDVAGTDNSTNVTLANTNYLSIDGQELTGKTVPITSGGTGATSVAAARTALEVDVAGTDNSTNVTLANTNYLSIEGQELTGNTVPIASGGTGATTVAAARTALEVDVAGTDNSTNVTLANTNYLSIDGQELTGKTVPITSGGTGATTVAAARTALEVDVAGTDNSTNVTLANTNYLSIDGQELTGKTVPITSGGTGATSVAAARTALEVDVAGTDNSTNVTLANTNYLSIDGQELTGKTVPITSGGTGATSVAAARTALEVDVAGTDNSTNVTLANTNYLSIEGQELTGNTVPIASGGTGATTVAAARTALEVDVAGTDNSTNVTLANTNYLSIEGQELTGNTVPIASGGTGATTVAAARTALEVDVAGTDNSTNVTLANTNYLSIDGQELTGKTVPITSGGTGATTVAAARTALEVDVAGTDNSTNVTLANTNYLSIDGQELTGKTVPITSGGTGATSVAAARTALEVDVAGTDNSTNVTLANTNYLSIDGQELTGKTVPITSGGTGATTVAAARTALEVDVAGTDNSTNVTLANTNYLSIEGQELTGNTVPIASGGTGATTVAAARTALEVDVAGTDNSTNVTLANTNYLSIDGQELTGKTVPITSGGTGITSISSNQILIGNTNGTGFDKKILTAGSNINITNQSGDIVIAYTGSNQTGTGDIDDGAVTIPKLNLNSGTDIGADLTDLDLIVVHDMSSNQIRKSQIDRIYKYINSKGLTSLGEIPDLTITNPPTNSNHAANKSYVDSVASGLDIKKSVKIATTTNGTFNSSFSNGQMIDEIELKTGDRILIKNQDEPKQNGIYTVNASGSPARATDFDSDNKVSPGCFTFVEEGTTNADTGWVLATDGSINLGDTGLTFTQFSGAGLITGGSGLSKTGNTLNINVDDSSIEINNDQLKIKNTWTGSNSITTLGTIGTGTWNGTAIGIASGGTGATTATAARAALGVDPQGTDNSTNVTLANNNYLSISGQQITGKTVPVTSGGTGATSVVAARIALDVDPAGTDNSTNVTLANTNYLSINGQQITGKTVPVTSGGTGATTATAARAALGVDPQGTDNSTNVTLANNNYLSISGQQITGKTVPVTSGGTGATSVVAARIALDVDPAGTDNSTNVTLANTNYLSINGQQITGKTVPVTSGGTGATSVVAARIALDVDPAGTDNSTNVTLANTNYLSINGQQITGKTVPVTSGGTGATTAEAARLALGIEDFVNNDFSGSSNITTVGTIGTGTWNGNNISTSKIDIANATAFSETLADDDKLVFNDVSDGTNKSCTMSKIKSYINTGDVAVTIGNLDIDGATEINGVLADNDLFIIDDVANGTNKSSKISRIYDYINNKGLTSLGEIPDLTITNAPTNSNHAANKSYVDSVASGLDVKKSVKVATTTNGTFNSSFSNGQMIDEIELATGDRILIKNQEDSKQNGIYTVNASGSPTRATDFNSSNKVSPGCFTFVEQGTTNADTGWVLSTDGNITLGTTDLEFTQFSGAGLITAGSGLTKTGNTLNINVDDSSIEINNDQLKIKNTWTGSNSITTLGTIGTGTWNGTAIGIASGGTGATTATAARAALGVDAQGTDNSNNVTLANTNYLSISGQEITGNNIGVSYLDIANATAFSGTLADDDKLVFNDVANGTNKSSTISKIYDYINNKGLTSLGEITNIAITNAPTNSNHAANKSYVDSVASGLDVKKSVRVATTEEVSNFNTDFANGQMIDEIELATGDRILIKNQDHPNQNGIYTVNASGSPTRATDFDNNTEVSPGCFTFVEQGATNADTGWVLSTDGSITLGTTDLEFTQFSGAGLITAGSGLTKTGNTLNINVDDSSIGINGEDKLEIKNTWTGSTNITTLGTIVTGTWNGTAIGIAKGGTGATTDEAARSNLGLAIGTNVQAQNANLTAIAGLSTTDGGIIVGNGTTFVLKTEATARTSLGLAIGSDVQAYDAHLAAIAGLDKTDGGIIVGNGTTFVLKTQATARTSLGLGTSDNVTFNKITANNEVYLNNTVYLGNSSANSINIRGSIVSDLNIYPNVSADYNRNIKISDTTNTNASNLIISAGSTTSTSSQANGGNLIFNNGGTGTSSTGTNGSFYFKTYSTSGSYTNTIQISNDKEFRIFYNNTKYVGFKAPDLSSSSTNTIWTLPTADGLADQVLKTDGDGGLGWASSSSGVTLANNNYLTISGQEITGGTVPIASGGTGATDQEGARSALGLGTAATSAASDFATSNQGTKADNALPSASVSNFGGTLIDDADAATARSTLGLGTSDNVTFNKITANNEVYLNNTVYLGNSSANSINIRGSIVSDLNIYPNVSADYNRNIKISDTTNTNASNLIISAGSTTSTSSQANGGNLIFNNGGTGTSSTGTNGSFYFKTYSTSGSYTNTIQISNDKEFRIFYNNTKYVGFKAPDLSSSSTNTIWTLPTADGLADQVLKTDGDGGLGWASSSSGVTLANNNYLTISGQEITGGTVPIASGGTGATDQEGARSALGLGTAATSAASDFATSNQGTKADNALPSASVSNFGGTLIDDADAATARSTLGLGTSDNVTFNKITANNEVYLNNTVYLGNSSANSINIRGSIVSDLNIYPNVSADYNRNIKISDTTNTNASNLIISAGSTTSTSSQANGGNLIFNNGGTGTSSTGTSSTGTNGSFYFKTYSTSGSYTNTIQISNDKEFRIFYNNTKYVGFKAPDLSSSSTNTIWTLPTADGLADQVLKTDGDGGLGWASSSSGVTLANNNYLTISGQEITGGTVPIASGGTGSTSKSAARSALGVDAAGTDNSTNVTLANTNYLTISGQEITGGTVPIASGGTGSTSKSAARSALGVDAAGTDNSTNVTLANTNYLTISGQEITGGTVPIASGGTGSTSKSAARSALGVDAAGTDNSTNVTLANTNYLTISGQEITGGTVPIASGGTGSTSKSAARSALGVDAAGTDNSTNVTLANTNYLTISGQEITGGTVPIASGGTGATSAEDARTALGVDAQGTDNSTNVTLLSVDSNYLSIDTNQVITAGVVPISLGGTGSNNASAARSALELGTTNNVQFGNIKVSDSGNIGCASDADLLSLASNALTVNGNIKVSDSGNIGCASDADLLSLAANTLTVNGSLDITSDLDVDGKITIGTFTVTKTGSGNSDSIRLAGPGNLSSTSNNPSIYLLRGHKYKFINNAGNRFHINVESGDSAANYTTGVTNNGSNNDNSSSGSEIIFDVPHEPTLTNGSKITTLYYRVSALTQDEQYGKIKILTDDVTKIVPTTSTSTHDNHYITFLGANSGDQTVLVNASIKCNPNTGTIFSNKYSIPDATSAGTQGSSLTVQSASAATGTTNTGSGNLILAAGKSVGNNFKYARSYAVPYTGASGLSNRSGSNTLHIHYNSKYWKYIDANSTTGSLATSSQKTDVGNNFVIPWGTIVTSKSINGADGTPVQPTLSGALSAGVTGIELSSVSGISVGEAFYLYENGQKKDKRVITEVETGIITIADGGAPYAANEGATVYILPFAQLTLSTNLAANLNRTVTSRSALCFHPLIYQYTGTCNNDSNLITMSSGVDMNLIETGMIVVVRSNSSITGTVISTAFDVVKKVDRDNKQILIGYNLSNALTASGKVYFYLDTTRSPVNLLGDKPNSSIEFRVPRTADSDSSTSLTPLETAMKIYNSGRTSLRNSGNSSYENQIEIKSQGKIRWEFHPGGADRRRDSNDSLNSKKNTEICFWNNLEFWQMANSGSDQYDQNCIIELRNPLSWELTGTHLEKPIVIRGDIQMNHHNVTGVRAGIYIDDGDSRSGNADLQINTNGKIIVNSSDRRLKKNIVYLDSAIDKINGLKPCTFEWKEDETNTTVIGLIAQDVEKVIPEAVFINKSSGMRGLHYKYITATMIKGMQDQQEIINQQKEKIEKQQTEIDSLKIQMAAILARLDNLEK